MAMECRQDGNRRRGRDTRWTSPHVPLDGELDRASPRTGRYRRPRPSGQPPHATSPSSDPCRNRHRSPCRPRSTRATRQRDVGPGRTRTHRVSLDRRRAPGRCTGVLLAIVQVSWSPHCLRWSPSTIARLPSSLIRRSRFLRSTESSPARSGFRRSPCQPSGPPEPITTTHGRSVDRGLKLPDSRPPTATPPSGRVSGSRAICKAVVARSSNSSLCSSRSGRQW